MISDSQLEPVHYLRPTHFVDANHPDIQAFTVKHTVTGEGTRQNAIRLYLAVRDEIVYDPYWVGSDQRYFRASDCLAAGRGFCIPKAALLAACARAAGIPARVGYADVRNHLSTQKLDELTGGNVYTWHSYTDLFLDSHWVKATPAFNKSLCERFGVHVLEFDGRTDSLFQEYNQAGHRHMEYVRGRGVFEDVPYDSILADFERHHAKWLHHRSDLEDPDFEHHPQN